MNAIPSLAIPSVPNPIIDWRRVVATVLRSRALDDLEESRLLPARKVLYQFTARGHDVTQVLLGQFLDGKRDAVAAYYRSRPLVLSLRRALRAALPPPTRSA